MSPAALFVLTGWLANVCATFWLVHTAEPGDVEAAYTLRYNLWLSMAPWSCVLAIVFALHLDEGDTQ